MIKKSAKEGKKRGTEDAEKCNVNDRRTDLQ